MRYVACLLAAMLLLTHLGYTQKRSGKKRTTTTQAATDVEIAPPTIASPYGQATNSYSNNQVATSDDILVNRLQSVAARPQKVLQDALIIYGTDGAVRSWDMLHEKTNWTYKEEGIEDNGNNHFSIDGALLYLPFENGTLTALDVNTGEAAWVDRIGLQKPENSLLVGQAAPVCNNLVFISARNNVLYAVDKKNGDMVWNYKLDYPFNIFPPLVLKEELFVNNAPYIYKFEAESGRAVWQRGFSNAMYSVMVTDGRRVYAGDESKTLYAIDPADTSHIDWKFQMEDDQYNMDENLIAGEGVLYLSGKANPGSVASSVYAVKMSDGSKLWRADLPKSRVDDLVLDGKVLYGYMDEGIFVLDATTGKQLAMIKPEEAPLSNILSVSSDESILYLSSKGLVRYSLKNKKATITAIPGLKTVADRKATLGWVKKG